MFNLPACVDQLVGVIDLKGGAAVHAVAGQRDNYRPVSFGKMDAFGNSNATGDPIALAQHYQSIGIRRLYVADLDGIVLDQVQTTAMMQLLLDGPPWDAVVIDIGWRSGSNREFVTEIHRSVPQTSFIVATEAARQISVLAEMVDAVGAHSTILGMDYLAGEFVSRIGNQDDWFAAANQHQVNTIVTLDIATVGTGNANASLTCCRIARSALPESTIYSGGGIQSEHDVQSLIDAGCNYCLAATVLHGLG